MEPANPTDLQPQPLPTPAPSPSPQISSLQQLLQARATCRQFTDAQLSTEQLATLLAAAGGVLPDGRRTHPSAHGVYPVSITVVSASGTARYDPRQHRLLPVVGCDQRVAVSATTLVDADWLCRAAVILVLACDLVGMDSHFADQRPADRGRRYALLEAGHLSQNLYLSATELGLGAALVGGFDDDGLTDVPGPVVPQGEFPVALLGIGNPDH